MDITRTGAAMAATLLTAAVAMPLLVAGPASATYEGNDGRLYFGAFAPAEGNTADLYSTHIGGRDLRQLTDSGPPGTTSAQPSRPTASASRCAATGPAPTRSGR